MTEEVKTNLRIVLLEILAEVDRICKKYNLTYFLDGGTLLGAVRHEGFIPWDDDIDVAMPRADYEQFLGICAFELSDDFYITTPKSKCYHYLFAKIEKKNTLFLTSELLWNYKKLGYKRGIYVDIFPLDNIKSKAFFNLRKIIIRGLTAFIAGKLNICNESRRIRAKVKRAAAFFCSFTLLKAHREFICKRDNKKKNCKYFTSFGSQYNAKRTLFLKEELLPVSHVLFEGKHYPAPKNPDYFLRTKYGENYMELPPLEKRISHNPVIIKLGGEEDEKI
jgi:lipopolysaccharide cholinephosphotransferase